jgi:bifunctional non-homologous end joining protein LigD
MIWDQGTYTPAEPNVGASLRRGEIKFTLHGKKLRGSWVLVRTRGRNPSDRPGRTWLLIKHRDEEANTEDIAVSAPRSVVSDRILAEIAFDEGGDVQQAASADPPEAIEEALADPHTASRRKRKRPTVWHSKARA